MNKKFFRLSTSGMSLIELLISICLAFLLIELLIEEFISCKKNYEVIQARLEREYEVLLITEFLRDSIRRAGFTPCLNVNKLFIHDKRREGHRIETESMPMIVADKSYLQINRMSDNYALIIKEFNKTQLLVKKFPVKLGHPIIIADCYRAVIYDNYQIKKTVEGVILTLDSLLPNDFIEPYFVGEWLEERFYIHKNSHGTFSLFYKLLKADELSSLISTFTVELIKHKAHTLVQMTIKLLSKQEMVIKTSVRSL